MPAFTTKNVNLIDRFVNTKKWDVEDANKWKTSDDNRYYYDIE